MYEDVPDVLRTLHASGVKIGLISNSHRCLTSFESHFELSGLFTVAISSVEHGYMKPHPSIFEAALRGADVVAAEAVMVGDNLTADITIKLGDKELMNQPDAQFISRPGRIAGVDVVDLDKQLKGMKSGETRTIKVKVPDTHPQEEVRGKEIEVTFNLKDIKRLELAEIDAPFLESLGFTDEKELREALREQMVERINYDVQQSMREQIKKEDPYFEERMHITAKVMGEEFGRIGAILEPGMREGLSKSLAKRFTVEQLADVNRFFGTSSGHAFAGQMLSMWVDPEVMKSVMGSMPELMKAMPEMMKKVEAATAHLPKPKAKAKAKPSPAS